MPNNKKGNIIATNGRPLSISSIDSEELQSGEQSPYDISELEKDSETLSRKAAKRLKRSTSSGSESFVEKFIGWHNKKKVDKIKSFLDSLFPRLKDREGTVKTWLVSVSERKEQVWSHGSSLLVDMENQISTYQKHLDFLDEVVNDIRQIDYDILKEVTELRVAFTFNQELLNRPSPKPSFYVKPTENVDVVSITVHSSTVMEDINKEQVSEPAVWQNFGTAQKKVLGSQPAACVQSKPAKTIFNSLMQSMSSGHNGSPVPVSPANAAKPPSTVPGLTKISPKTMKPVIPIDARSEAVLTSANKSQINRKPSLTINANAPHHRATNSLDGGLDNLAWDGEESKRKSLSLSCVSLQSLKLGISDSPTNVVSPRVEGGNAKSPMVKSNGMNFSLASFRSSSANFTGSGPDGLQVRGRSHSLNGKDDVGRGCSTPPNLVNTKSIQVPQPATPISRSHTHPNSFHNDSTGYHYSSSDESGASISDEESHTPPNGLMIVTPKYGSGRKTSSTDPTNAGSKLNLHRLLLKVDSHEYDLDHLQTTDPDQLEMAKRIKKCLLLKDTLKSVLTTVQTTQDTETMTLKKMKKLRNELKTVVSTEEAQLDASFCSLNQALLGSASLSASNSSNNLQALGLSYSSDDNARHCRELRAHSSTPPSLLQQSFHSNNNSAGSVVNRESRRNSSPLQHLAHQHSANIPIIPQTSRVTPSQSAAVAASGVAAFSFMTTATTGSEVGKEELEEKQSICSQNTSVDGEHLNFEEVATEIVDDLKALIQEETEARLKLAKITNMIDNANHINEQYLLTTGSHKVK